VPSPPKYATEWRRVAVARSLSVCLSVTDDGGVFKSRTVGGRVETRGASEVRDSRDTRTDLPLDYLHAQPVHVRTVHRLIGRYRRSKHRKFVITSKLAADEPLRQLTLSLTLALTLAIIFAQTMQRS